ncbi:hypothetical protein [Streptomyces sp. NPDC060035]|uniref:hypothetical protein n=1 Tax=Streptomyces sp. NPDC060035 TaxID=3347044 RepID=UPI0036D0DB2E
MGGLFLPVHVDRRESGSVRRSCAGLVPQIFAQRPLPVRENVTPGRSRTFDDVPAWNAIDGVTILVRIGRVPRGRMSIGSPPHPVGRQ